MENGKTGKRENGPENPLFSRDIVFQKDGKRWKTVSIITREKTYLRQLSKYNSIALIAVDRDAQVIDYVDKVLNL